MYSEYSKFEIIILQCMIVLLGHVVGVDWENKANDLIDEIRRELR